MGVVDAKNDVTSSSESVIQLQIFLTGRSLFVFSRGFKFNIIRDYISNKMYLIYYIEYTKVENQLKTCKMFVSGGFDTFYSACMLNTCD